MKKVKVVEGQVPWKIRHYTDFYFQCMKQGHDVRIVLTGDLCWYAMCVECDVLWCLTLGIYWRCSSKLTSVAVSELKPGTKAHCDRLKAKIMELKE